MGKIKLGDVIYVKRDCGIFGYKHFGIYSGNEKVIHYTKNNNSDDIMDGIIRETSLKRFLEGDTECYICEFDDVGHRIGESKALLPAGIIGVTASSTFSLLKLLYELFVESDRKLYSPEETVRRAREHTKAGKNRGYNLFTHNCEHFAIWCKTGVEESKQIDELLELINSTIAS